MPSSRGRMLGGIRHRPFPLLKKEELVAAAPDVPATVRLTFGLHADDAVLGFGQPNTAVKARPPGSWVRSRPYSICSDPGRPGSFDLLVKLYPGGRVCGHLGRLQVGESAWLARTRSKPMAADVSRAGLIAFGIGISDCIQTATALLVGGADEVRLMHAVRTAAEVTLADEVTALALRHPGRFHATYFLSREPAGSDMRQLAGSAAVVRGRLDRAALEAAFGGWARDTAFMVVGTREMNQAVYHQLREMGLCRLLVGFRGTEPPPVARGGGKEDFAKALL